MNGHDSARAVTHAHGRSFAFAALALDADRRSAAYILYAFFRRLDDAFDGGGSSGATLADARRTVAWLFGAAVIPAPLWPPAELQSLKVAIKTYALPRGPFDEMLDGMAMDLHGQTYEDELTLALYCDRVAGTVGELMACLLGASARVEARALGRAMQLTNILRDVAEDRARGRVYLPGVSGCFDDRWQALAPRYVGHARQLYAKARPGIVAIDSFRGRWLVEMMARIYADILRVIERRRYDVFSRRARVGLLRKLWLLVVAFVSAVRR